MRMKQHRPAPKPETVENIKRKMRSRKEMVKRTWIHIFHLLTPASKKDSEMFVRKACRRRGVDIPRAALIETKEGFDLLQMISRLLRQIDEMETVTGNTGQIRAYVLMRLQDIEK